MTDPLDAAHPKFNEWNPNIYTPPDPLLPKDMVIGPGLLPEKPLDTLKILDKTLEPPKYIEGAIKYDQGKPRMELVPLDAVKAVAEVMTFGAAKYAPNGWRNVDADRYRGALLRHLEAIQQGETNDKDSGLPHIAHVACNALFLTHFEVRPSTDGTYEGGTLCY